MFGKIDELSSFGSADDGSQTKTFATTPFARHPTPVIALIDAPRRKCTDQYH